MLADASPDTRMSLILRLPRADDNAAWEEFVELYAPVVRRVALKCGLQAADAENVAQNVMLRVSRHVSSWLERSNRGRFRAWLISIARNQAIDELKRNQRWKVVDVLGGESCIVAKQDDIKDLINIEYEQAVFQWAASRVRAIVAEQTWQAFWLTHVDGVAIHQVATQLGVRPGVVYFARCRVMKRLKELVSQYEESE